MKKLGVLLVAVVVLLSPGSAMGQDISLTSGVTLPAVPTVTVPKLPVPIQETVPAIPEDPAASEHAHADAPARPDRAPPSPTSPRTPAPPASVDFRDPQAGIGHVAGWPAVVGRDRCGAGRRLQWASSGSAGSGSSGGGSQGAPCRHARRLRAHRARHAHPASAHPSRAADAQDRPPAPGLPRRPGPASSAACSRSAPASAPRPSNAAPGRPSARRQRTPRGTARAPRASHAQGPGRRRPLRRRRGLQPVRIGRLSRPTSRLRDEPARRLPGRRPRRGRERDRVFRNHPTALRRVRDPGAARGRPAAPARPRLRHHRAAPASSSELSRSRTRPGSRAARSVPTLPPDLGAPGRALRWAPPKRVYLA